MVTIMSEKGKLSTHLLVALVLLAISLVFSSQDKLTDRQVLKKEIFIQKLAAKMDSQTGARSKREIVSIHSPPLSSIPDPGEGQNQSSISGLAEQMQHCSLRSIRINFDMIGWTHILAPKEISYHYCEGVCDPVTVGPHVFTTSAAYVLYKLGMSGSTVVDPSCCSPNHLSHLELLVTGPDEGEVNPDDPLSNLEVITIPDMLVTSCGCN